MSQTNLFPEQDWLAPKSSKDPAFWIREIQILSELKENCEIRKIPFHRGLNIIWAQAADADELDPSKRGKGHSAGKTTLCRLIRYVLGEDHYGNDAIRKRLPNSENLCSAWVIAKVIIGKIPWIVARPLYSGGNKFALKNKAFSDIYTIPVKQRNTYEEFTSSLAKATMQNYQIDSFDKNGTRPITWLHIIQWLSRDQESHLSGLLKWRSPESDSGSPELTGSDPQLIVRTILGITNKSERNEIEIRKKLLTVKQKAKEDISFYERSLEQYLKDINSIPNITEKLPEVHGALFTETVSSYVKTQIESEKINSDKKIALLKRDEKQAAYEDAVGKYAIAKNLLENKKTEKEKQETTIKQYSVIDKPTEEVTIEFLKSLKPDRQFCEIPISTALFQCEILKKHRLNQEELPATKELNHRRDEVLKYARAELEKVQDALIPLKNDEVTWKLAKTTAKTALDKADADIKAATELYHRNVEELNKLDYKAQNLNQFEEKKSEAQNTIKTAEMKIEKADKELTILQQEGKEQQLNLNEIFNQICQFIKGSEATGTLTFTKHQIESSIYADGERDSGAYKALKCLVFDYTALIARLNGIGNHPGFLLHDSPRESDMELSLYHPIFHLLHKITLSCPESFQYIVTSTEAPPKEFQNKPICILKLDGADEDGRLFRENLSD